MTKFAHYNSEGVIVGFYDDALHHEIPEPHLEIEDDAHSDHVNGSTILRVEEVDGEAQFFEFAPPPPPIEVIQAEAKHSVIGWINALTDQLTSKYSTIEIAGFVAKKIEAQKVQDGEPGPFPMLESEASLTGETIHELTTVVLAKDAAYEAITAAVTGLRRNTFTAIDAATSASDVQTAIVAAKVSASAMAEAMGLTVPDALGA
ncbi:hypothetical protein [Aliiroseovarius lamellibrachiae]|uniref:hypothetical protein n=1 Tax=Aliiroseovarius lamellibrachiae TaxID=1924933 RepID=UPI001BE0BCE8|nr:hypothetical protein [Aliiroseovarius lamellibrachiae]MBT2130126.1 hypothetical protein [Aliiroseovarius lamellibrachiae]